LLPVRPSGSEYGMRDTGCRIRMLEINIVGIATIHNSLVVSRRLEAGGFNDWFAHALCR